MNGNASWLPYNNGLANVRVDMLKIRDGDNLVLASTHGRGQFYGTYNLINEYIEGDINNDNQVNVLDVVLIVNIILDGLFVSIADLNNDMAINVLDVVILVNSILDDQ